jgi:hypothetical protein
MSARNNGHGRPTTGTQVRRNRTIALVVVIALVLAAFGIGYVLASSGGDDVPMPASPSASISQGPSASPEPSESPSEEASESVSAAPADDLLPDDRYFVYARAVGEGAEGPELTFDLAYYLTDEAAQEAADAADDELTNGYYIVNDNPKLRTMPIAPDAVVRYVPEGTCCNLKAGNLDAWSAAVNGTAQTDYPNMDRTGWWLNIQDGEIVRIAQQWVP